MAEPREVLAPYVPPASLDQVDALMKTWRFQLRITRKRMTKVGDYRPPSRGLPHRITVNHDLNQYAFLLTLIHEIAHLVVHEEYGRTVSPHGKEWKQEYRKLLEPFMAGDIFPKELQETLKAFFDRKGHANRSDLELNASLRCYDPPNGRITVAELPDKSLFKLPDGRLFIKGELMRKRFRCHCLNNRRQYLVSHMMEVYPVHHQYPLVFPE